MQKGNQFQLKIFSNFCTAENMYSDNIFPIYKLFFLPLLLTWKIHVQRLSQYEFYRDKMKRLYVLIRVAIFFYISIIAILHCKYKNLHKHLLHETGFLEEMHHKYNYFDARRFLPRVTVTIKKKTTEFFENVLKLVQCIYVGLCLAFQYKNSTNIENIVYAWDIYCILSM